MSIRAEILELGHDLAKSGKPSRCEGCDKPGDIGCALAMIVLSGEIDRTEAVITLRNDLDANCQSGIERMEDVDLGDDSKCGYNTEPNSIIN